MRRFPSVLVLALLLPGCAPAPSPDAAVRDATILVVHAVLRDSLTSEQAAILIDGGTERPFTSALLYEKRAGTYYAAGCDVPLFRSEQKFDSGTGWPSFWAPASSGALILKEDATLGITRTEVRSPCGGHLGHVFDDGPPPTGLRYCMNGDALVFVPDAKQP